MHREDADELTVRLAALPAVYEVLGHGGLAAQRATLDHALLVTEIQARLARELRALDPPVVGRVHGGAVVLDLRALLDAEALIAALGEPRASRA